MASSRKCLDELEHLSGNKSLETQQQFLKRVVDLFFITQDQQGREETALFGRVMMQVIVNVSAGARRELAEKLARAEKAPREIVSQLASDSIDIARPLLRHSVSLDDAVLLNIIENNIAGHLLAICERDSISGAVSDALLERCCDEAIYTLARNAGARISPSGFDALIGRAANNESIRQALFDRPDKPEDCFDRIKETISYTLKSGLVEKHPKLSRRRADEMSFAKAERVLRADQMHDNRNGYELDSDAVKALHEQGGLTQYTVAELARNHQERECVTSLALLGDLEERMVAYILLSAEISALGIFCKTLHFSRDSFLALLELKSMRRRMTMQVIATALKRFDDLTEENAQHIMRFLKEQFGHVTQ